MENQVRALGPLSYDPSCFLYFDPFQFLFSLVFSFLFLDPFYPPVEKSLCAREVVVCLLRSHDCVCSRTCFYHGQLAEHLVNLATVPVCPSSSHEWVLISFSLVFACIVINLVVHLHIVIVYSLEFLIYNDRHNFN